MITNNRFSIYKVSEELYGVSSTDKNLSQKLNKALGYKKYKRGTRFTSSDEPLFHFSQGHLVKILRILGIDNVDLSLIGYPSVA